MDLLTHGQRVELLIEKIGQAAGFSNEKIFVLKIFAMFHDIGKLQIPLSILTKPDKLTPPELLIMEKHSEIGSKLAQNLSLAADLILKHHERWDGNGYPLGLKGIEIPLECRILSILDAYDVMTHKRPYKKAISPEKALNEIRNCSGTQFDPDIVNLVCCFMEKTLSESSQHSY